MQLKFVLPVLAAVLPFVAATSVGGRPSGLNCKDNEFEYKDKNCCLPRGGPKTPPTPPKETACPPTSYYWEPKQGCCVPRNPPPPNPPQPQCPKGWTWTPALYRCVPTPPTPTPTTTSRPSSVPTSPNNPPQPGPGNPNHPQPGPGNPNPPQPGPGNPNPPQPGPGNPKPGHPGNGPYHKRAAQKSRSALCPTGLDACPISSSSLSADYECVDTANELEACGGCPALGLGQDCTKIEGAWNVGCEQSSCIVYTCAGGFRISPDGASCIPL